MGLINYAVSAVAGYGDGTGELFGPLIEALPNSLYSQKVAYPQHEPLGYPELLNLNRRQLPAHEDFVALANCYQSLLMRIPHLQLAKIEGPHCLL